VIIPDQACMNVTVTNVVYQDYTGVDIAPSKGNLYRNVNPEDVPYVYGPAYAKNEFYPAAIAKLRDPYILRDYRGQAVVITPFAYNPVTKTLRVYMELTVKMYDDKAAGISKNRLMRSGPVKPASREFQSIYSSHFKNPPPAVQYAQLGEEGKMLIISYGAFMPAMQSFIDWKRRRGIEVEMVDMATVGSTENDVMQYVANYYNANGLTYLLLVGDYQQIPSPLQSPAQTGGASDPSYGYITGADSYAEVMVGRFSAQTVAEVETQVLRTLNYERNPIPSGAFYGKGVCIASNQGPGDDNEFDWEHERIIRDDLIGFTYSQVDELYDGTHGGMDAAGDPNSVDLFNILQNGVGIITYTGHGSTNACSTTGFSSNDVASLTNYNMLPFIWSVACVNGDFTTGSCLAEAFMQAQAGGMPTGAQAAYMSSINQSWDPPMDAQDEMVDLLVGSSVYHTMRTFGGLSVNGCLHMNDEYGNAGAEMTDTWHCFGDPSLLVRTAPPTPMTVTHIPVVSVGTTGLLITCNTDSAFVTLSLNGDIIGTGTVLGGTVLINFSALTQIDSIDVTVTAFNKIPYTGIVDITGVTGIGNPAGGQLVSVFPNPAKDLAVVSLNMPASGKVTITVYDLSGKKVALLADRVYAAGKHDIRMNTGSLNAGTYYCRVVTVNDKTDYPFTVVK